MLKTSKGACRNFRGYIKKKKVSVVIMGVSSFKDLK